MMCLAPAPSSFLLQVLPFSIFRPTTFSSHHVWLVQAELDALMHATPCTFTLPSTRQPVSTLDITRLKFIHVKSIVIIDAHLQKCIQPANVPGSTDRRLSVLRLPVTSWTEGRRTIWKNQNGQKEHDSFYLSIVVFIMLHIYIYVFKYIYIVICTHCLCFVV